MVGRQQNISVVIAEDNPEHLRRLSGLLQTGPGDIDAITAASAAELLVLLENRSFDCIVLNYRLPDGIVTGLVPKLTRLAPQCPIIVTSNHSEQSVVIDSLRSGCVDFVPKSDAMTGHTLRNRILLAVRRQRRAIADRRRIDRRNVHLALLAETDPLTGLANRRGLDRAIGRRNSTFDRRSPSSVLLLDVDRFKQINDSHGHHSGDKVLSVLGEMLRSELAPGATVCRWGGEEFVVLIPDTSEVRAVAKAESIRRKIEVLRPLGDDQFAPVTVSIGVATCGADRVGLETVLRADEAMYLAKRMGRNRVCTHELAEFARKTTAASRNAATAPAEKLNTILTASENRLGPLQWEHLTTHSTRVAEIAADLGETMGVSAEGRDRLHAAGLFHDLGKYIIPESLLAKPLPLTTDERLLVDHHGLDGADMCRMLGLDDQTADCVRFAHLHRRGDPQSHAAPPLESEILSAVDAFITMQSDRPYRSALTEQQALRELGREQRYANTLNALSRKLSPRRPMHAAVAHECRLRTGGRM